MSLNQWPVNAVEVDASGGAIDYAEMLSTLGLENTRNIYSITELAGAAPQAAANRNTKVFDKWPIDATGKWVVCYEDNGVDYYTDPAHLSPTDPKHGSATKVRDDLDWLLGLWPCLHGNQLLLGWFSCGVVAGSGTRALAPATPNGQMVGGVWIPYDQPPHGGVQTFPVRTMGCTAFIGWGEGSNIPYNTDFGNDIGKLFDYIREPDARNFYGRGHGPDTAQGLSYFFRIPSSNWKEKLSTHRYRFAFLDGCQTANEDLLSAFGMKHDEWTSGKLLRDVYGTMTGPLGMDSYPNSGSNKRRPGLFLGYRTDALVGLWIDPSPSHTADANGCKLRSYDALCNWHLSLIGYWQTPTFDFIGAVKQSSDTTMIPDPVWPFPRPDFTPENGSVLDPVTGTHVTFKPDDCLMVYGYGSLKFNHYNSGDSTWP